MSIITILLFSLFLTSQISEDGDKYGPMEPRGVVVTDPTFSEYIKEFEYHYGKSVSDVPIAFADLKTTAAGVCFRSIQVLGESYSYIKIDQKYWPKMSEIQRRSLIMHELGHCVLKRKHVESNSMFKCPTSFMHDTVMYDYCLDRNYNEYIKEMFP